jgi:hypothetical protein
MACPHAVENTLRILDVTISKLKANNPKRDQFSTFLVIPSGKGLQSACRARKRFSASALCYPVTDPETLSVLHP